MRKIFVGLLFLVFISQSSYAFIGGITNTIKAGYDKAYQTFMKIKVVEQIRVARQNYLQAKRYHEDIKRKSHHKGGIVGYYVDEVKRDIDRANKDIYWRFQYDMNSDPDETAYIRKWAEAGDKYIETKTDYSKEIHAIGKKRDKRLKKIADDLKKKNPSKKDINILNNEMRLMELELLADIARNSRKQLKEDTDQARVEWEMIKREEIKKRKVTEKQKKEMVDWIRQQKQQRRRKKDPYKILREIPK